MKIMIGLFLSLLLAPAALTQTAETVFNDAQGKFSISVPASWRVKKTFNEGTRFEATRGNDAAFEYIAIAINPLPNGTKITPTAYANVFLNGKPEYWQTLANAMYPDAKVISKGAVKISGQDGIFLIGEGSVTWGDSTKTTERTFSAQTVFQGEVIGISFSAPAGRFPSLLPEYQKILATTVLKTAK